MKVVLFTTMVLMFLSSCGTSTKSTLSNERVGKVRGLAAADSSEIPGNCGDASKDLLVCTAADNTQIEIWKCDGQIIFEDGQPIYGLRKKGRERPISIEVVRDELSRPGQLMVFKYTVGSVDRYLSVQGGEVGLISYICSKADCVGRAKLLDIDCTHIEAVQSSNGY